MRGISALIDLDTENSSIMDENSNLSVLSEPDPPKKRGAKKTASATTTNKPKSAPRKARTVKEEGATKPAGKTAGTKRKAAQNQNGIETSQPAKKRAVASKVQSEDELDAAVEVKPVENPKPRKKATTKKEEAARILDEEIETPDTPAKAVAAKPEVVSDGNPPAAKSGDKMEEEEYNAQTKPKKTARQPARPTTLAGGRRRAGSASDTERGDPNLRRKLGDVTRKYENIDLKYRSLREVGIVEANSNMEKLRKQCESTTSASNDLIASLKKELSMHMPLANEARQLQADLRESKKRESKTQARLTELESSLATAQNEVKALQAKLAAARSAATHVESSSGKAPGTPKKTGSQVRTVMVGSAEAAQAAQTAQLKEDLYSDLTGLIVRGVKRTDEGDFYDCIQTGRNGSEYPH